MNYIYHSTHPVVSALHDLDAGWHSSPNAEALDGLDAGWSGIQASTLYRPINATRHGLEGLDADIRAHWAEDVCVCVSIAVCSWLTDVGNADTAVVQ